MKIFLSYQLNHIAMFKLFRAKRRKNNLISFNPDGTPVEDKSYRDLIACSIMITLKVMQHSFYLKEKVAKKFGLSVNQFQEIVNHHFDKQEGVCS